MVDKMKNWDQAVKKNNDDSFSLQSKITESVLPDGASTEETLQGVEQNTDQVETKLDEIKANQTNKTQSTKIVDSSGKTLELEDNNAVPVNIQDQTTDLFSNYLLRDLGAVTLASPTAVNDYSITLVGGHGTQVGEMICLKQDRRCFQARVLSVNVNTIGLDSPLDYPFTVEATAHRGSFNMAVNGSVTPAIFQLTPTGLQSGTQVDINKISAVIEDNEAMDSGKFGGITALTKGVIFRKKNGVYKNILNVKTNGAVLLHDMNARYDDKAPAGSYAFRFTKIFNGQTELGVAVRLNADDDDALQVIVQDDLSGLTRFSVIAHGHVVQN